jgi:hypothetical protein
VTENPWALYQRQPSFVLGFHGTDARVVNAVVERDIPHLDESKDTTEWLGHGVYFWENDPERAMDWARHGKTKGKIESPAAVGAIIDLGFCLDLTTLTGLNEVAEAHDMLNAYYGEAGLRLPQNTAGADKARRELDCAVIQALHVFRKRNGLQPYDSVRSLFPEDAALFTGSGFRRRNHLQICIVNPERCIRGYFRPIVG